MASVSADFFIGGLHERNLARYKSFYEWYRRLPSNVDSRLLRHRTPILRSRLFNRFVERVWTPRYVRAKRRQGSVLHVTTNLHAFALLARPAPPAVATCHHAMTCGERGFGSNEVSDPKWEERHNEGLRVADRVVAPSEFTRAELVQGLRIPRARTAWIPMGVDLGRYHPLEVPPDERAQLGFAPAPAKNLLYVGTEAPRKNLGTLLRVLARLREERDVRLVKVGPPRPPHHVRLRRLADELGVSKAIMWVGDAPERELPLYYASADALVLTTTFEGFGLPVLEGMACGLPVIASDAGSVPEVGGDAILTERPDSVEGFSRSILRVLEDADLRARMRDAGVARAAKFPWQRTAQMHADLFEDLARSV